MNSPPSQPHPSPSDSDSLRSNAHSAFSATSAATASPASSLNDLSPKPTKQTAAPTLTPQCKSLFVEALVDSAAIIIHTIWPATATTSATNSTTNSTADHAPSSLPLKTFIQETLRRSRTSYSTLQLALYYLLKLQPYMRVSQAADPTQPPHLLRCGRRGFLASLMIASKYVQDRNFSAATWSKISGLPTAELCENELLFLKAIGWNAHVKYSVYERLSGVLFECACDNSPLEVKQRVWSCKFAALDANISPATWHHHQHAPKPLLKRKSDCQHTDSAPASEAAAPRPPKKQRPADRTSAMRIPNILNHPAEPASKPRSTTTTTINHTHPSSAATLFPSLSLPASTTATATLSARALSSRILQWSQDVAEKTAAAPFAIYH